MNVKYLKISLCLFVFLIFIAVYKNRVDRNETKIQPKEFTTKNSLELITEQSCRKNLEFLCSDNLEGRMSGKKGNVMAADFLKSKLNEYGLKTYFHKFKIKRVNSGPNNELGDDFTQNVYGWVEGESLKDEIIVVGAHFDHIGYGPQYSRSKSIKVHNGADDNASGTVAVLEVAKAMSRLKPKRTILFQFYSAEEMGLLGSRFYCENPTMPESNPDIKKHIAMINLDMIGHLNLDKYNVSFSGIIDLQENINNLNKKYKFANNVTGRGTGGSDHASFYNKKIPVAFIHTGLHKYYHTPEDDIETLNLNGIVEISKYVFELSWNLANEENTPQFNHASFKEMPYDHDHGSEILFNTQSEDLKITPSPRKIFRK
jgi:hypothetical protein